MSTPLAVLQTQYLSALSESYKPSKDKCTCIRHLFTRGESTSKCESELGHVCICPSAEFPPDFGDESYSFTLRQLYELKQLINHMIAHAKQSYGKETGIHSCCRYGGGKGASTN